MMLPAARRQSGCDGHSPEFSACQDDWPEQYEAHCMISWPWVSVPTRRHIPTV